MPKELRAAIPWKIFGKDDIILIPYSAHLSQNAMRQFFRKRGVPARIFHVHGVPILPKQAVNFLDIREFDVFGPFVRGRKYYRDRMRDVLIELIRYKET